MAFGGDGTINEAANGLAGSEVPLTCLPGGSTKVFCRTLGIPADVVDATEHLLALADDFRPRRVDLGRVDDRYLVFASGIGLDASVVERVDSRPHLKASMREWYFTYSAVSTFLRRYMLGAPRVRVEAGGRRAEGVTAIVQNGDPFTFFGSRPIRVCEAAGLDRGDLAYRTQAHEPRRAADGAPVGFFFEDGAEVDNTLKGNLGFGTRRPPSSQRLLPSDGDAATYWITNPDNTLKGNVAGGSEGFGF